MNEPTRPSARIVGCVLDAIRRGMTLVAERQPACGFGVDSVRFRFFVDGAWCESAFDGEGNPIDAG